LSRPIDEDSVINEISRFSGYLDDDMILRLQIVIKRLPTIDAVHVATTVFGKWIKDNSIGMSPGGTPGYVCSQCGGSFHLHGAEYPRRKMICDKCGSINSYPWEKTYEEEVTE